jgi:DNA-binding transcriptional LysR family regulator
MEMQQIRYFVVVAETLNFTHAAERCNVSQPSLTRAIQLLELELGGELIRRERSLTHLTELGSRMLPLMQQCYETALAAKGLAQSVRKGESSPLSLAVSWSVDLALFAPYLYELSRALRGLQLTLRRGSAPELAQLLKSGQVELAVGGPLGETWDRLETFPLFVEPFELVMNRDHAMAGRDAVALAGLSGERLLVQVDAEMAGELDRCLCDAGIDTGAAVHRVASGYDLVALLEANLGMAVMPASAMRSERLCRIPLDDIDLECPVALYAVAGRRRSVAGSTLMNLMRSTDWSGRERPGPIKEIRHA